MQDTINSFKAHLYERTSSPLVGSFIFYWLVCNYKLVMVFFDGDLKVIEKFEVIKTLYPQDVFTLWNGFDIYYYTLLGNGLLIPLIITLVYIFIVPYPAKYIYEFWKNKQKEIQEIKQKIDDETPLTKEQSKKIRQYMVTLEIEYDNDLKRKDEEIFKLKEKLNSEEDVVTADNLFLSGNKKYEFNKKEEFRNKFINYNKNSLKNKALFLVGEYGDHVRSSSIGSHLGEAPVMIEEALNELESEELVFIDKNKEVNNEHVYYITNKGKEILRKLIKDFKNSMEKKEI